MGVANYVYIYIYIRYSGAISVICPILSKLCKGFPQLCNCLESWHALNFMITGSLNLGIFPSFAIHDIAGQKYYSFASQSLMYLVSSLTVKFVLLSWTDKLGAREMKPEPRDYLDNLFIARGKESKHQKITLDDILTVEPDKYRSNRIDDLDDYLSSREDKPEISRKNEPDNFFNDWIERYM